MLHLEAGPAAPIAVLLPIAEAVASRGQSAPGWSWKSSRGPADHPRLAIRALQRPGSSGSLPKATLLRITAEGVGLHYRDEGGLRAAAATLRQLLHEYGRPLAAPLHKGLSRFPQARRDAGCFSRAGAQSPDAARPGGAPGGFQAQRTAACTPSSTFAYRNYEPVWHGWGPLTGEEMLQLDARCRRLGIDLVPQPELVRPLAILAGISSAQTAGGDPGAPMKGWVELSCAIRPPWPPKHPGTLPFLRGLFDELLPHFTSPFFNVGCDETWDPRAEAKAKAACEGPKQRPGLPGFSQAESTPRVGARNRRMMFWGDIILHPPGVDRRTAQGCGSRSTGVTRPTTPSSGRPPTFGAVGHSLLCLSRAHRPG